MTEYTKCGDNRFEVIKKAKADILDKTNIDSSPEEMAVLDNILFRCWQMGWLKKYEEPTEGIKGNLEEIPLSEFEKNLERKIKCYTGIVQTKNAAKQWAKELMSLAKKELYKDLPKWKKQTLEQAAIDAQQDLYDGFYSGHIKAYQEAFKRGAKWMAEQIKGGSK